MASSSTNVKSVVTKKVSKPKSELLRFLFKYQVTEKDAVHTHTGMGTPKGCFNIPDDEEIAEEFMRIYTKEVIVKGNPYNIIEKHTDVGPVVIDIDLRFDLAETIERQYTIDHVKALVTAYRDEILEYCEFEDDELDNLKAFIFERPAPYATKTNIKDGIHIMFPFVVTEPNVQYIIRENIMRKHKQIFSDIPVRNGIADIYDRSVIYKNGWIMYGCAKPGLEPYKLTHVFDEKVEEEDIEEYNPELLPDILSLRNKKDISKIRDDKKYEIIKYSNKKPLVKKIIKKPALDPEEIQRIYDLVMILAPERVESYETWIEVGWCLHNINPECADLLNIWIEWSKTSTKGKFEEGKCEQMWDTFKEEGLGMGSLYYWAKKDNYSKFLDLKRKDVRYYIEKSMSVTHYDVAVVLKEMYKYQYVCVSIRNNVWYEFKEHRWSIVDSGISLKQKMSTDLVTEYVKLVSYYNELISNPIDENGEELKSEAIDDYIQKTKILTELIGKVKNTSFKKNLMSECCELFYEKDFENKLDNNPYLIGFADGVYDLEKREFREGRPDDYLTFSTENNYVDYDEENEYIEQIDTAIYQMLPNDEVREYVMLVLSSFLEGVNADESFHIWTGSGRNGKSKLWELFELSFGEYCIKFPITLLTQKRGASNACSPEVAQSKGKRAGNFQEPDENERINVGLMKELTGSDKIKARALYKEPIEFKPQFKLALLCNKLPDIPPGDEASWMRLKVVEFTSKFVDNPTKKNEFKKDGYLSQKLIDWKETFMSILLHRYYPLYKERGIIVPDEVSKFTREYQKTCDDYSEFIEKYIVYNGYDEEKIDMNEALSEYRVWYGGDSNTRDKNINKKTFKMHVENLLGKEYVTMNDIKCHRLLTREEVMNGYELDVKGEPTRHVKGDNTDCMGDMGPIDDGEPILIEAED